MVHICPLYSAIKSGYTPNLSNLLKNDPEILYKRDFLLRTPLIVCSHFGHFEMVEFLLDDCHVNANEVDGQFGSTALYTATRLGHIAVIHALLQRGADPCLASRKGITPLMVACHRGYTVIVELLIKAMRSPTVVVNYVNREDEDKWTALNYACCKKHADIVKILLFAGENPHSVGRSRYLDGEIGQLILSAIEERTRVDLLIKLRGFYEYHTTGDEKMRLPVEHSAEHSASLVSHVLRWVVKCQQGVEDGALKSDVFKDSVGMMRMEWF